MENTNGSLGQTLASVADILGKWTITKVGVDGNQDGQIGQDEIFPLTEVIETYSFEQDMTGEIAIAGVASATYAWSLINNDQDIFISPPPARKALKHPTILRSLTPDTQTLHIESFTASSLVVSFTMDNQLTWYFLTK